MLHEISFQLREGVRLKPEEDPSDSLLSPGLEPTAIATATLIVPKSSRNH